MGFNIVEIDGISGAQGRIPVTLPPPEAPPGTTSVQKIGFSDVSTTTDILYTITNTKTLILQRLYGGAEELSSGQSSVIELYEDPNGNLNTLNIIMVIYANGNSNFADLTASYVGNGTRRILLRCRPFAGGARSIFCRWDGYEE